MNWKEKHKEWWEGSLVAWDSVKQDTLAAFRGGWKAHEEATDTNRRELEQWARKRWRLLKNYHENLERGTLVSILTWERLTDHYVWMEKLGIEEE